MSFANFKNSKNLLNAEQMKRVNGGQRDGTCGFVSYDERGNFRAQGCGISKADVMRELSEGHGGYWCCDSCGSTFYC